MTYVCAGLVGGEQNDPTCKTGMWGTRLNGLEYGGCTTSIHIATNMGASASMDTWLARRTATVTGTILRIGTIMDTTATRIR